MKAKSLTDQQRRSLIKELARAGFIALGKYDWIHIPEGWEAPYSQWPRSSNYHVRTWRTVVSRHRLEAVVVMDMGPYPLRPESEWILGIVIERPDWDADLLELPFIAVRAGGKWGDDHQWGQFAGREDAIDWLHKPAGTPVPDYWAEVNK